MAVEQPDHFNVPLVDLSAVSSPARLRVVASTGLLGRSRDAELDAIVGWLARERTAPICVVAIVDAFRQVFASSVGLPEPWRALREAPLARSRSQIVVATRRPLAIDDALLPSPVATPAAMVDRGIRAWIGAPIVGPGDHIVGVLAMMDEQPRAWQPADHQLIIDGAARAAAAIERRIARLDAQSPAG